MTTRRRFLKQVGVSLAALPFVSHLQSFGFAAEATRKKRLVVLFSPNGVVPDAFWPEEAGTLGELKPILSPLAPFKDKLLTLHGVCDKIRGDGDNHMRGIGCLLTGTELFPGNIQGGSHTPAGWASGISIDQEIKNHLQSNPETKTRFGSLEFGVVVPDRADTWTRMCYSAANKPITPVDDPYQMFTKLYGQVQDRELLGSVLDDVQEDLNRVRNLVSKEDRQLLDEQTTFVREMEKQLSESKGTTLDHPVPVLEPGLRENNDNLPQLCKMQIDLMVNSFQADFARVASLQITNSVGQARMKWLEIDETHHTLSHEPDSNEDAQAKLVKINTWYCSQMAYLAERLAATPEPGGEGSMLDNTLIVWTNELGKGNSHTLDNIPFVLLGGGLDVQMGRSLKFDKVPHNRLLLTLAHSMGHHLDTFGNPDFCTDGPLVLS
ncbi:MAG: DUF1552 domain-containing protein [Planctomycetaceae bacterium]|nr:DUF1552 domain-containing protein [Planctomycetaceae bacterium]MCB9952642.1 DUF1552 domain-containing protein [Planctomycetaceae bacterium]